MLIPRITQKNGWFNFNAENHIKLPWSMVSIPCTWNKTWKNAGFHPWFSSLLTMSQNVAYLLCSR